MSTMLVSSDYNISTNEGGRDVQDEHHARLDDCHWSGLWSKLETRRRDEHDARLVGATLQPDRGDSSHHPSLPDVAHHRSPHRLVPLYRQSFLPPLSTFITDSLTHPSGLRLPITMVLHLVLHCPSPVSLMPVMRHPGRPSSCPWPSALSSLSNLCTLVGWLQRSKAFVDAHLSLGPFHLHTS